jgi:DMSO/TMAO reductase YedYZ molybdopterin-dependent catalytic subunit
MADALHPQTLVTYGMNGGDLPVGHGGRCGCAFHADWDIKA